MFVWEEVNRANWLLLGAPKEIINHISAVIKTKYDLEKQGISNPDISQIAKHARVSKEKAQKTLDFLAVGFESIEQNNEKGSTYDLSEHIQYQKWLSEHYHGLNEEKQRNIESQEKVWDFKDEDIGFIIPKIGKYLMDKWGKEDAARHKQFASAVEGPARCLKRRLVFLNGSLGMIDLSILVELNKYASGSEAYDRRRLWKDYSRY